MSKRNAPSWCPYNVDDKDEDTEEKKPCPKFDDHHHGVYDPILHECISDINDVIEMSDGRCYGKESLRKWYYSNPNKAMLPMTNIPFEAEDFDKLGLPKPIVQNLRNFNAILGTNYDNYEDVRAIRVHHQQLYELNKVDFTNFTSIDEITFVQCTFDTDVDWMYTLYDDGVYQIEFTIILDRCSCIPDQLDHYAFYMSLHTIHMSYATLPEWINEDSRIVGLYIHDNPAMERFPSNILDLEYICNIEISNTRIRNIPDDFIIQLLHDFYQPILSLIMDNNAIEYIPEFDDEILNTSLSTLSFRNNNLKEIPNWIQTMIDDDDIEINLDGNPCIDESL
jgi:hypothetical protein